MTGGPLCPSGMYVVLGTQALIPILPRPPAIFSSPPVCPHPLPTTELETSQNGGGETQSLQNHSTALGGMRPAVSGEFLAEGGKGTYDTQDWARLRRRWESE